MLKPDVFLCLVVVSAITLLGGESRSDGSSDGGGYNSTGGGLDSSLLGAQATQRRFLAIQTNTEADTIRGNMGMVPTALTYDPNSDVVLVCDGDSLYSVNKTTGATTFIGTYFQNEPCNPTSGSNPPIR